MHASEYTDKSDTDSGDGGVGRKAVIAASHTTRENDEDSVYTGYSNPIRVSRRLCSPTSITNIENNFLSPFPLPFLFFFKRSFASPPPPSTSITYTFRSKGGGDREVEESGDHTGKAEYEAFAPATSNAGALFVKDTRTSVTIDNSRTSDSSRLSRESGYSSTFTGGGFRPSETRGRIPLSFAGRKTLLEFVSSKLNAYLDIIRGNEIL